MKNLLALILIIPVLFIGCNDDDDDTPTPNPPKEYIFHIQQGGSSGNQINYLNGVKVILTTSNDYYSSTLNPVQLSAVSSDTGYAVFSAKDIRETFGVSGTTLYAYADDTTNYSSSLGNFLSFSFDDRRGGQHFLSVIPSFYKSVTSTDWEISRATISGFPSGTLIPCFIDNYIRLVLSPDFGGLFTIEFYEGPDICSPNSWLGQTSPTSTPIGSMGFAWDSTTTYVPGIVENFSQVLLDSSSMNNIKLHVDADDSLRVYSDVFDYASGQTFSVTYTFGPKN